MKLFMINHQTEQIYEYHGDCFIRNRNSLHLWEHLDSGVRVAHLMFLFLFVLFCNCFCFVLFFVLFFFFFVCFVPKLLVCLDCPFLIAHSVFSNVYIIWLSSSTSCARFDHFIMFSSSIFGIELLFSDCPVTLHNCKKLVSGFLNQY